MKIVGRFIGQIVKLCLNTYLVSSLFYSSIKHIHATRQKIVITAIFVVCQEQDGIYRYLLCKSCILVILNLFKISFGGASKYPEHIILHTCHHGCLSVRSQMNFLLNGNFLTVVTFLLGSLSTYFFR